MKNYSGDDIQKMAQILIKESEIEKHFLFQSLQNNTIDPQLLKSVALEIYHVVLVFPRFLSALITQIEDYKLRMDLVANLYEEHGNMKIEKVHSETYFNFLKKIGLTESEIRSSKMNISSIVYTRAILDLCLKQNTLQALAALAIIEEIVARVSISVSQFTRNLDSQNSTKKVDHFSDHEVLDLSHSKEIYDITSAYSNSKVNSSLQDELVHDIEMGLRLGLYYQHRLYDDVIKSSGLN